MALKTGLLTIVTLGFYRFWMKTRLRRWYWSAIRLNGEPLEYTGTAVEKLLGFLIAVVFLSFYIGIVNLLLMFVSFSFFQGNGAGYFLSVLGVVPFWFYAQYRARRYVLARTRWRGLRFGLEPGAWGYALRALGYWIVTLFSCGLLLPLMTFKLEQYKTDRTFFGNVRMTQGGSWTMLYRSMAPLFLAAIPVLLLVFCIATGQIGGAIISGIISFGLMLFGLVFYRVDGLRRLTAAKEIVGGGFVLNASVGRVVWIYVSGSFLTYLAFLVPLGVFGVILATRMSSMLGGELDADQWSGAFDLAQSWALILSVFSYFVAFLLLAVLTHVTITMPIMRHYAKTLTITGTDRLAAIRQRPRDTHTEAEGFAEALDVGASI